MAGSVRGNIAAKRTAGVKGDVMLYLVKVDFWKTGNDGPVKGASEAIEAIEAEGWHLDQMTYDGRQSSNGGVLLLFRRVQPESAQQWPAEPAQQAPVPPAPQQWQQPAYQQPGPGQFAAPQPGYHQEPYNGPWPPR